MKRGIAILLTLSLSMIFGVDASKDLETQPQTNSTEMTLDIENVQEIRQMKESLNESFKQARKAKGIPKPNKAQLNPLQKKAAFPFKAIKEKSKKSFKESINIVNKKDIKAKKETYLEKREEFKARAQDKRKRQSTEFIEIEKQKLAELKERAKSKKSKSSLLRNPKVSQIQEQHVRTISRTDNRNSRNGGMEFEFSSVWELYSEFGEVLLSIGDGCDGCEGNLGMMDEDDSFDITDSLAFYTWASEFGFLSYYFQFIDENESGEYDDGEIYAISCEGGNFDAGYEGNMTVAYNGSVYHMIFEDFWMVAYDFNWGGDDEYDSFLEGLVMDFDGNPIADAVVGADDENTGYETFTDDGGYYHIELESGGIYNLYVEAGGYWIDQTMVEAYEGGTQYDFVLGLEEETALLEIWTGTTDWEAITLAELYSPQSPQELSMSNYDAWDYITVDPSEGFAEVIGEHPEYGGAYLNIEDVEAGNTYERGIYFENDMQDDAVFFEKEDYADVNDPANWDHITDSVAITRGDQQGLYNPFAETHWNEMGENGPAGTLWAPMPTNEASEGDYTSWGDAVNWNPPHVVDNDIILSLWIPDEDEYWDIDMVSWTSGDYYGYGSGGGFSYWRYPAGGQDTDTGIVFSGAFGGTIVDGNTYTFPTGAESWGGFANEDTSLYPFTFPNGGLITFTGANYTTDVEVYFRFEYNPYPDTEPSFNTESVTVNEENTGETSSYSVEIPAQGENTFSSFLLYVTTPDAPVTLTDVTVTSYNEEEYGWVHGNVYDFDYYPIGNATVWAFMNESDWSVNTDTNGYYSINLPVGEYDMMAEAPGYSISDGTSGVIVMTDEWTGIDFYLGHHDDDAVFFEKEDYADVNDPANWDHITESVAITRGDQQGLYNPLVENHWNESGEDGPAGTLWAPMPTNEASEGDYTSWGDAVNWNPPHVVDNDIILSLWIPDEDEYWDIDMVSWTSGDPYYGTGGGGFSYWRYPAGGQDDEEEDFIFLGEFEGHEYYLSDSVTSWNFANTWIDTVDLDEDDVQVHMVTINSHEENDFLHNAFVENSDGEAVWLGFTDEAEEGNWQWVTGEEVTYTNWADGEPNNSNDGEHYAVMDVAGTDGQWNDISDVQDQFQFIVEVIWDEPDYIFFEKEDYADVNDPDNWDHITESVAITRGDNQGLYNPYQQDGWDWGLEGPAGTLWKMGPTDDVPNPGDYGRWRDAVYPPPEAVGQTLSLWVLEESKYYDIEMLSWTSQDNGGGFSYNRYELNIEVDCEMNYNAYSSSGYIFGNLDDYCLECGGEFPIPLCSDETIYFQKDDYADWTDPVNWDEITDNVAITRADEEGLFNPLQESGYSNDGYDSGEGSPLGTLWKSGPTIEGSGNYVNWRQAVFPPPSQVGKVNSVNCTDDNVFYDIYMTNWTSNGEGGGFAYYRSGPITGEPAIIDVTDFPDDQGGRVYITFEASVFDTDGLVRTEMYTVQRMDGETWVGLSSVTAYGTDVYTVEATTVADSTSENDGVSTFRIIANMDEGLWASEPVDGYSVDNIAPDLLSGFDGTYENGMIILTWDQSNANDFSHYAVYHSNDSEFLPDESTLLETTTSSEFSHEVTDIGEYYYIVTAFDIHENESEFSETVNVTLLSLDDSNTIPTEFAIYQNHPNPFNPSTQIQYALPTDANVSIAIYDLMGRQIRSLVNEQVNAGYHSTLWNATNDLGSPVSAGVYIYTIQAGEFRDVKKMILLK